MGKRTNKKSSGYFSKSLTSLVNNEMHSGNFMCSLSALGDSDECRHLFLNLYDEKTLREHFAAIGLIDFLEKKGFRNILLDIGRDDKNVSRARVYHEKKAPGNLLIDTRFSETLFRPFKQFCAACAGNEPCIFQMVVIEWIESMDPRAHFGPDRPQLPGQRKPGLGVLALLKIFLAVMARDLPCDGFLNVPEHIHAALMYADAFAFMDPVHEGNLRALRRDLGTFSLADIAWGFITGTVYDRDTGTLEIYHPNEQIYPVSTRMKSHFDSKKYKSEVKSIIGQKGYTFDFERMKILRAGIVKKNKLEDL